MSTASHAPGWAVLRGHGEHGDHTMGHVLLTLKVHRDEDDFFVGECEELEVSSFGGSLDKAFENVMDAVLVYLNTLEDLGDRETVFAERNLRFMPQPTTATAPCSVATWHSTAAARPPGRSASP